MRSFAFHSSCLSFKPIPHSGGLKWIHSGQLESTQTGRWIGFQIFSSFSLLTRFKKKKLNLKTIWLSLFGEKFSFCSKKSLNESNRALFRSAELSDQIKQSWSNKAWPNRSGGERLQPNRRICWSIFEHLFLFIECIRRGVRSNWWVNSAAFAVLNLLGLRWTPQEEAPECR